MRPRTARSTPPTSSCRPTRSPAKTAAGREPAPSRDDVGRWPHLDGLGAGSPRAAHRGQDRSGPVRLVVLWEVGSTSRWWSPAVLPPPGNIAQTFWHLLQNGQLLPNLWASLRRVLIGSSIGVGIGTVLGISVGLWRFAEEALDSTLQMMRTLPYLVLLPLFIVWFGVDELPKILIIAIGTSLPMYLNTSSGVRNVDPRYAEMATTFGLRRPALILTVIIPGALPAMLTGLRYSLGIGWLSLVVAEQINAQSGLGLLISNAESLFQMNILMVCVVIYAVLGLTTDLMVRALEHRLLA